MYLCNKSISLSLKQKIPCEFTLTKFKKKDFCLWWIPKIVYLWKCWRLHFDEATWRVYVQDPQDQGQSQSVRWVWQEKSKQWQSWRSSPLSLSRSLSYLKQSKIVHVNSWIITTLSILFLSDAFMKMSGHHCFLSSEFLCFYYASVRFKWCRNSSNIVTILAYSLKRSNKIKDHNQITWSNEEVLILRYLRIRSYNYKFPWQ